MTKDNTPISEVKDYIFYFRNSLIRFKYKYFLKPVLFKFYPETTHDSIVSFGSFLGRDIFLRNLTRFFFDYQNPLLEQKILGIKFANPIGLAAGFDKNAHLVDILPSVGFGFVEVGSITGKPCHGNQKPRLWRLQKSKGLVVHYGLKNDGCVAISNKLRGRKFVIPVGTNIAKTNSNKTVGLDAGVSDYVKAFSKFTDIGAYFTINISCPNAYGGQPFTDPKRLEKLLSKIDKISTRKPIFLKLSPDLTKSEVDAILTVVSKHKIDGFVCTNLTKNRNNKKIAEKNIPDVGGISGKVVEDLSNELISYIFKKTNFPWI